MQFQPYLKFQKAKAITCNIQRAISRKKKFLFSPGNLLIILYQLSKFEAPSCNVLLRYQVFYVQICKWQKLKKYILFIKFSLGNLLIILYQPTNLKLLAVIVFEIS